MNRYEVSSGEKGKKQGDVRTSNEQGRQKFFLLQRTCAFGFLPLAKKKRLFYTSIFSIISVNLD